MRSSVWRGLCAGGLVLLWIGSFPSLTNGQSPSSEASNRPGVRVGAGIYDVVYRPPSAEYRIQEGEQFDLIYQAGAEDMAWRTRRALRESWPGTDTLVGGTASDFQTPVVINNYNDRSNGFVTAFPFRQEIETPSLKSSELVARSSSWPAIVGPHELVHSAHLDVQGGLGVGSVLRVFAPDWARAMNLLAPRGLTEGVAVYRESQIEPGAGRLNAPLFQMKMKASMLSEDPWSLTQMMEPPAYTKPFDRFYVGGAHAFEYLAERGDSINVDFFQEAVRWHNRFPFLGHGIWMGLSTGQFPHELKNEIQSELQSTYEAELTRNRPYTSFEPIASEPGLTHRRPYWLDEETLVAYVYGYDVRPGFYRIDAATGQRTPIRIQSLTEDRVYSLSRDTTALYASRYVPDPLVLSRDIAEVERVELETGDVTRLTEGGRTLAPAEGPEGNLYAVRNDGAFTRWVEIQEQDLLPMSPEAPTTIRQVAPTPKGESIALLINIEGDQRIYRTVPSGNGGPQIEPWVGLEGAIIYDVSWGPEGRYLLFAADHPDTANIFAFDTEARQVLQLANVPFGALEPTLSPDRSTLAFVNYQDERHDLVRLPFRPDSASVVPDSILQLGGTMQRPSSPSITEEDMDSQSYSAWRHLSPRMVYPRVRGGGEDVDALMNPNPPLGLGVGIGVAGSDPLQRWTYRAETYWQNGRLWGEARVQSGRFLLRPSLSAYNRAYNAAGRIAVEERGAGVGLRLPIRLQSNIYQSFLRLGLDTELRQTRLFGERFDQPSSYATRFTLSPQLGAGYRLQQNTRDVVPNTGLLLNARGEVDGWTHAGQSRRAVISELSAFLPVSLSTHTGVRLGLGLLSQNQSPVLGTSRFVPRGYEDISLPAGTMLRLGAEVTQPLWYIDDGTTIIPFYAKALSVYGFGQTLGQVTSGAWRERMSSVGGGISLEARFFYLFDLDLRLGAAYRLGPGDVEAVHR